MLIVLGLVALTALVSSVSVLNGLGLWLLLMVVHGGLVTALGEEAVHLPLYAGLAVVLMVLVKNRWRSIRASVLALLLLLAGVMVLAALFGFDQQTSAAELLNYAKAALLAAVLAGTITSADDARVLSLYLLASLIAGALITLYQQHTGHYAVKNIYEARAAGLRTDPNDTAMLLVAGVPLQIYWLLRAPRVLKPLMLVGLTLLHVGIVLTGSRGGFVALLLVYAILYLRRPTLAVTAAGMVLALLALLLAPQTYRDRMMTLVTQHEAHGGVSLSSRQRLLEDGLSILGEHAVLGVGAGNFGRAFVTKGAADSGLVGTAPSIEAIGGVAHNMYLEFFVENGLVGGAAFLTLIVMALRGLYAMREGGESRGRHPVRYPFGFMLMASLAGMLASGIFLSQEKNSVLWFLIGVGLATVTPGRAIARVPAVQPAQARAA